MFHPRKATVFILRLMSEQNHINYECKSSIRHPSFNSLNNTKKYLKTPENIWLAQLLLESGLTEVVGNKTNLPVILLNTEFTKGWLKGESLCGTAAFGWSAGWEALWEGSRRPPHVIPMRRPVETGQTLIQMQPQPRIHFLPRLKVIFLFFSHFPSHN